MYVTPRSSISCPGELLCYTDRTVAHNNHLLKGRDLIAPISYSLRLMAMLLNWVGYLGRLNYAALAHTTE